MWTPPKIALLLKSTPVKSGWKQPTEANAQTARIVQTSPRQLGSMEKTSYGR